MKLVKPGFVAGRSERACDGRFRIGEWTFTARTGEIAAAGGYRRLEPLVADVLRLLAEHPGELVSRAQLFDLVWKDRVVVDETLTRAISLIRAALGDAGSPRRYVETLPKRGYRLIASVRSPCEPISEHLEHVCRGTATARGER